MILTVTMTRKTKLLSALRRELRISDGLVRRLKPLDAFRVNGERAHTNRLLEPGDLVAVTIEEAAPDFPAEDGPLDVLYEDDCLIAVDKPAGLIVHPTFARQTGTLANYLLGHYRRTDQACAVHVLTRLDRDTMGVVIFAKNAWAHWLLMEELDAGRIEKVYEALTVGGPEADEGLIDLPIAKRPNPSLLRWVSPEGKPAQTRFRVLERGLPCPFRRPDCPPADGPVCPPICRLELRPLTGRTHQLRVHCSYLGFPILGDPQYGMQNATCKTQNEASPVGAAIGRPHEGSGNAARAICPPDKTSGNRQQASDTPVGTSIACPPKTSPACRGGGPASRPVEGSSRPRTSAAGGGALDAPPVPHHSFIDAPPPAEGSCGQQLVARRITLDHPLTGERLTFVSKIALCR